MNRFTVKQLQVLGTPKGRSRRVIFYKLPADSGRKGKSSCLLRYIDSFLKWDDEQLVRLASISATWYRIEHIHDDIIIPVTKAHIRSWGKSTVCWVSLLGISYCDYIIMILISHLLSRDIIFIMMLHFSTSMWSTCSFSYHIMTTCRSVCLCPFSRLFEARSRSPRRRPVNVFASKRCADVVCDMMLWSTHKSNQVFNSFFFMGKLY